MHIHDSYTQCAVRSVTVCWNNKTRLPAVPHSPRFFFVCLGLFNTFITYIVAVSFSSVTIWVKIISRKRKQVFCFFSFEWLCVSDTTRERERSSSGWLEIFSSLRRCRRRVLQLYWQMHSREGKKNVAETFKTSEQRKMAKSMKSLCSVLALASTISPPPPPPPSSSVTFSFNAIVAATAWAKLCCALPEILVLSFSSLERCFVTSLRARNFILSPERSAQPKALHFGCRGS